jgi:hypothetical protein
VQVRRIGPGALPESLASRQFVPPRGEFGDDFDGSLGTLATAIETDLESILRNAGCTG